MKKFAIKIAILNKERTKFEGDYQVYYTNDIRYGSVMQIISTAYEAGWEPQWRHANAWYALHLLSDFNQRYLFDPDCRWAKCIAWVDYEDRLGFKIANKYLMKDFVQIILLEEEKSWWEKTKLYFRRIL